MNLKKTILSVLGRDALRAVVDVLEIEDVDRRSVEDMASALSRAHRATPEMMLEHLSEAEVKAVCDAYGVSSTGRRTALIESLLKTERQAQKRDRGTPAKETRPMNDETPSPAPQEPVQRLPEPPPGMFRITRTELVWPGKYNEDGTRREVPRVSLPFQVIETVNESRATREVTKVKGFSLFDTYQGSEGDTFEEGWRNKLIWGDNLLVMGSLLEKFAGKVDLIYIDPPFATGIDFSFTAEVGDNRVVAQ